MSIILAIESSSETASVAVRNGTRLWQRQVDGVQTHSHSLLPMVQAVLAEAGLRLDQCDAIAFGAGPGSFTGVRTACGIAQGLAFGSDLPLLAVDTLATAAQACHEATGAQAVLVVIDARMGEVYWAQYRFDPDGDASVVTAPQLGLPASVTPVGAVQLCGNGVAVYADAFQGAVFEGAARADLMPHAAQGALLGQRMFARGQAVAARDAQPVYLRNQIALTTLERALARAETVA
ncbi:MAG: tRNA (adenosine(37)-N6)-threonylcarbamoyltransferase complex dimerization subunit type 1 TsaB [Herminiimonas sp.]|nr:tRNA (adenosine(37)-N6)-threonylcarbamoyltransferase complex dimerization subunit type 1 TsaB [Herminiimonas sp.]